MEQNLQDHSKAVSQGNRTSLDSCYDASPTAHVIKIHYLEASPPRRRMFEVADDLPSGTWQSGPAFTTLTVADNHDGTETVTVTDNATVPSPATRPLGLDGSPPLF
jgi:hypothetical protein